MAQLGRNYAIILCALFAALLLVAFFNPTVSTRIAAHIPRPAAGSDSTTKTTAPPVFPDALAGKRFDGTWDVERDSRNLMLSAEQCEVAFPGLFDDIDHMVAQTKKDGIITRKYMEDIDSSSGDIGGFISGYIYDQQLYITHFKRGYFTRAIGLVGSISRAMVTSPEPLPNIKFTYFSTDDARNISTWGLTREPTNTKTWLMPDFGYWSWPEPKVSSYGAVQRRARQIEEGNPAVGAASAAETVYTWANKIPKLVWRGAKGFGTTRGTLVEVTADKPWADVKNIVWAPEEGHKDILAMSDHCKYKYVAHTAGSTYSGRLKYLQNCRSVIVAHTLEWRTHAMHLMKSSGPDQNFVEVRRDYTDLEETMQKLISNDAEAERIAQNNVKTFRDRYISPAAETCYWRRLIRSWSEVSEPPVPWAGREGTMEWNGVPAEDFMLMHSTDWAQH